ncbi:MAG: prolipoprotein diacylglyceryl transferase family protein [Candidatus Levyibacteriota bacterium]
MELLVLLPALLIFLFSLYRLVKDDYIFIRKGISLEQSYDISFITLWVSLFFSKLFYVLFYFHSKQNIFVQFFSLKNGEFSLVGAIIGGIIALFIFSKYRKIPLGRLSDFFSLSFLYALPFGLLANAFFVSKNQLLYLFLNVFIYFVVLLFFAQFLYPKILNRTMKEGMLSILFLVLFSGISLLTSMLVSLKDINTFIIPQNGVTLLLFIVSIMLLIRENTTSHSRRPLR